MCWTDEIKYKDEFKGELHFWREKTNSCGNAIGYIATKYFEVLKNKTDEKGRFLILEATIDNCVFIVINLRNPNTEKEQVSNWPKMNLIPETFDTRNIRYQKHSMILGGDFQIQCWRRLKEVIPFLKNLPFQNRRLRIRNTKEQRFIFQENHCSGFLQWSLDC